MSKAASAQYSVGCPYCGAKPYKPCESIKTRRVTDTHAARIEEQYGQVPVHGALARAEALAAGDEDWMNCTEWPRYQ